MLYYFVVFKVSGNHASMCMDLSESMKVQLPAAVRVLQAGGVLAYPTDTVYGLGCDVFRVSAVVRVFEVKRRPRHMPLPVLVSDIDQLSQVVSSIPPVARALAKEFWPGALTLILKKHPDVPELVTSRSDKIGVRLPAHSIPIFLARALGRPIVGTSANLTGMPSPRTPDEVRRQLNDELDMIIEGGECPGGLESTIIDLTSPEPIIVRESAIPAARVLEACDAYRENL